MYKIFLTCRNRLSITCKCITAIQKHSYMDHQIYVFDNLTNYKIDEHFMYWNLLYQKGVIQQITFNTKESSFNAFSKAVSFNQFGFNHEQDPEKDKCDFIVCLDNDIIVTPGWDKIIKNAWNDVNKNNMNNIKIIAQLPGGIKSRNDLSTKIAGLKARTGKMGGSGFWTLRNNFFSEVGYLNLRELVGHNKKHDQNYWKKIEMLDKGKDYILGLDHKLCIHVGSMVGSVCNTLTKNKNLKNKKSEELIKFEEIEEKINEMKFDDFYETIKNNKTMMNDW